MNSIVIEPDQSLFHRMGVYLKLFFSDRENKRQERRIKDLEVFIVALEEKNRKLLRSYQGIQDHNEVLVAMGITRLSDGAWLFNFDALLPLMHDEDITELRDALKRTTGH